MTALSTAIPPQNVPIVQNNGTISLPWLRFLQNLQGASGPGSLTALEAEVAALTTEVGNIASEVSQAVSEASAAQAAASIGQALGAVALRAAPPPLKTNGGAWTAWTPTLTPQSGTITSATASGRYQQIGRLVYFRATISITNAGSASGYLEFTLPVSALDANWAGCGYESAVTNDMIRVAGLGTTQGVLFLYSGSTAVTVTGYGITISGFYEAATG